MSVRSDYFKLEQSIFDRYLTNLKESKDTLFVLDKKYFYCPSMETLDLIISLNKKMNEIDLLFNTFSNFAKGQILQSLLIDEIEATNKIENIQSTRHDIFYLLNHDGIVNKDKRIIFISNAYKNLLQEKGKPVLTLQDLRELYDVVLKDAINKEEKPDGKYFRKGDVFVSDGIKPIHYGVNGEENINRFMLEFLNVYNSNIEVFTKLILTHFVFENVHPFYDGNGRFGSFMITKALFRETDSICSFLISTAFETAKSKYYKAFKLADDRYQFGCLNEYLKVVAEILNDYFDQTLNTLKDNINRLKKLMIPSDLTKSEIKIYKLIVESTIYSTYGVSNEEIRNETSVSKRTLIYSLNRFKSLDMIQDIKIGKTTYHKIKEGYIK